jgi:DNA-directed RNA polymerase sigma subunit (sigma70/sigma32)
MMVNVEEKQEYPTLLPLKDLSEVLGLSRMRVCQIEKQALIKLKALSGVDVDAQSSEEAGVVV